MKEISRTALFGKLNQCGYDTIERATEFCKLRGNPYVELVHWIHQMLQLQDSDLHRILKEFQLDQSRVEQDVIVALARLPRGATSVSDFSYHIPETIERGWVYATLMFSDTQVRIGHLIIGILKTRSLSHVFLTISREFNKISLEALSHRFTEIVAGSPEDKGHATDGFALTPGATEETQPEAGAPAALLGKTVALERFSEDLTQKARAGEIDPIVGRNYEIRQIIDILMRRRQNNPILTGEAGVGKTAVVEGFALRIASGEVPPPLRDVTVRTLDMGRLQAGAGVRGEFENRLRQVIEEVQSSPKPIVLFIDEAHTLVGAGGAAGTGDAANLLKPALARGTLRTIAATTWAEYKQYFENDAALTRRFQVVQVNEPSEDKAILMMRAFASTLEKHHRVQVLDEALEGAVKLSRRYIPSRQLPDKCVSLLDTAAARVAISQYAVPAAVEDSRQRLQGLETELTIIEQEKAVGIDTAEREATVQSALQTERAQLEQLEHRWEAEKGLVDQILALRNRLRGRVSEVEGTGSSFEAEAKQSAAGETIETAGGPLAGDKTPLTEEERSLLLHQLRDLQATLAEAQGDAPLLLPSVEAQVVASVVADWTGIPVGRMVKNEIEAVLNLAATLQARVVGQDEALEMIARRVQTSRAELDNPSKPIGVFLLCGPSGVGKTETGLALAEALYGGEENIITINMSEFQEAYSVSTLKGAPPGYKGYGKGGVLTEAVRRRPYSVVLLDEVEKAHRDVHEIFFQVFDKGWMEDSEGRRIDFRNTLLLLTSNVGTDLIMNMCKDPALSPDLDGLAQALRTPLLKVFPPALIGRLVVVPYYPLSDDIIQRIIRLQLGRIQKRIAASQRVTFSYDDAVVDLIAQRCTEVESGARMVDALLTNTLLPVMSRELLSRHMEGTPVKRIDVNVVEGNFNYIFD